MVCSVKFWPWIINIVSKDETWKEIWNISLGLPPDAQNNLISSSVATTASGASGHTMQVIVHSSVPKVTK